MATAKETRHAGLGLDADRLLAMYRQMVLARAVDRPSPIEPAHVRLALPFLEPSVTSETATV